MTRLPLAVLFCAITAAAATTQQQFSDAAAKVLTDLSMLPLPPAGYRESMEPKVAHALATAKCTSAGRHVACAKADADSLDAGAEELQVITTAVADEKTRETAVLAARTNTAALLGKVSAAIALVKDPMAKGDFSRQLGAAVKKADCFVNTTAYTCNPFLQQTLEQVNGDVEGLTALLAAVSGDNASNPRLARMKELAAKSNAVLAAVAKMLSTKDRDAYRTDLERLVGDSALGSAACHLTGPAYDCTNTQFKEAELDKAIESVSALLDKATALNADPRPALLKELAAIANRAQAGVALVKRPDLKASIGAKLAAAMKADGCALNGSAYDCAAATGKTEALDGQIGAVQGLIDAMMAANAVEPTTILKQKLIGEVIKLKAALDKVQDPKKKDDFIGRAYKELLRAGCGSYSNCDGAIADEDKLTAAIDAAKNFENMAATANALMDSESRPLAQSMEELSRKIGFVPNKDDAASLAAKLAAIAQDAGCPANAGEYDCAKTDYNQLQKAAPAVAALKTVVMNALQLYGPDSGRQKAVDAAMEALDLVRQLSPQSARDAQKAVWLAALKAQNCSAPGDAVDCSKATVAQQTAVLAAIATVKSDAQKALYAQEKSASTVGPNRAAQAVLDQVMSILKGTDWLLDQAKIPEEKKQPYYDKVSAMRDQAESGKLLSAPPAPAAGSAVTTTQLAQTAVGALGTVLNIGGSSASGTFGGTPAAVSQAVALQNQVKAAIAAATPKK